MKKTKILIAIFLIAMITASAVLTSCKGDEKVDKVFGSGAKSFIIEITRADGTVRKYQIKTDETTVGDALLKADLIPADSKASGFIATLDGITAAWDVDQSYWSVYIGDEYAMEGIFDISIDTKTVYKFVYTTENAAEFD